MFVTGPRVGGSPTTVTLKVVEAAVKLPVAT